MPPKSQKPPPQPSKSRDLVGVGPRHVQVHHEAGRRKDGKERGTTSRALVLRDGRQGARGTGEVFAPARMMGREKLELLAEDLMKNAATAVATPFKVKECVKIATAQFGNYSASVSLLRDHTSFVDSVRAEGTLLCHPDQLIAKSREASFAARMVGSKIHNTYMFTAGWKLIRESLQDFESFGFPDSETRNVLTKNEGLRQAYFSLYSVVDELYTLTQHKAGLQAMHSPHYKQYFKLVPGDKVGTQEVVFETNGLRSAYKSFLDSIVLELLLPDTSYPREILFQLMHESVQEAPKEIKRFPQALYETIGDLSVLSRLLAMLEAPLLGELMEDYKKSKQDPAYEYAEWLAAQELSSAALMSMSDSLVEKAAPLEKLRQFNNLFELWKQIDSNCLVIADETLEKLWRVKDHRIRVKQWHTTYQFNPKHEAIYDSEDEIPANPIYPVRMMKSGGPPKNRLQITQHANSDDDMPPLLSVSDSSDDSYSESGDEDKAESNNGESEAEFDYDTDEEDELREQHREAMDQAHATENFSDPKAPFKPSDTKGNPLIKLLGNLRGRLFVNKPNLGKGEAPTTGAGATAGKSKLAATVEEVEDEDEVADKKKKKKKPKKKPKKKADGGAEEADEPEESILTPASPVPLPVESKVQAPITPTKKRPQPKPATGPGVVQPYTSTTSLATTETAAQSAHSYLKSESLLDSKSKIKSRPNYATTLSPGDEERRGLFSRLGLTRKKVEEDKKPNTAWASKLTRKTKTLMHQLIGSSADAKKGQAPMKWDNFVKVMTDMGFTYVPDTAGSSVRFDPPDARDDPITFHKPHPDTTLYPVMLKQFGKKLKKHYGWTEDLFPED